MAQGTRLGGRYRLDERIGAGGMGEVWRATDEVLGRTVAVKLVLPTLAGDPDFVRRFLAEARAMASVNHPGVVSIHDYGGDTAGAFLVMEYVAGEPLSRLIGRVGRLTPAATMQVITRAAQALQAVHDMGIVHRDVKPANLLLRPDGAVMVTDFGVARGAGTALTSTGAVLGTPSYLAPEQVLGEPATARSDIYALGVVAYECLTGRRPFEADSPYAVAMKRVHEPPPPLGGDVPPAVIAVVERALATDPARRWRTGADLAYAAREAAVATGPTGRLATGPTELLPEAGTPARVGPPPAAGRVSRRVWAVAAAVALLAAVGVGAALWPKDDGVQSGPPAGVHSGSAQPGSGRPAGLEEYVACGPAFCPVQPTCWGGLNLTAGVAQPVRALDCVQSHAWETFAAGPLPGWIAGNRQDVMIERPEVASACAESVLADRSVDPEVTRGWQREPWPFQVDDGTWIFHCLAAGPEGGERTGPDFRAG
jgi:eukaryotic-like serine/threonine-protein kinase